MPAYSGLFNGVYGSNYALTFNRSPIVRRLSMALRRRSMIKWKEVIDTVANGSSINGAAAVTHKQRAGDVAAGQVSGGGKAVIETVTDIADAATVGTSVISAAQIDSIVDYQSAPGTAGGGVSTPNYPV